MVPIFSPNSILAFSNRPYFLLSLFSRSYFSFSSRFKGSLLSIFDRICWVSPLLLFKSLLVFNSIWISCVSIQINIESNGGETSKKTIIVRVNASSFETIIWKSPGVVRRASRGNNETYITAPTGNQSQPPTDSQKPVDIITGIVSPSGRFFGSQVGIGIGV